MRPACGIFVWTGRRCFVVRHIYMCVLDYMSRSQKKITTISIIGTRIMDLRWNTDKMLKFCASWPYERKLIRRFFGGKDPSKPVVEAFVECYQMVAGRIGNVQLARHINLLERSTIHRLCPVRTYVCHSGYLFTTKQYLFIE